MLQSLDDVTNYFKEREKFGIKPGLDRVLYLLKKVQHPERKIQGIHLAGTNGKGSTIQIIDTVLQAHQYRVGVFTSPSFTGVRGHFYINGVSISEIDFIQLLNELIPHIEVLDRREEHPTEFEILTVVGFMYFAERTDIVLVESGMGGRFDTTNCFTPLISVITTIDYDHMGFLGNTLEEITFHKAGIMKQERPLVVGKVTDEVRKVIETEAKELAVPVYAHGIDFQLDENIVAFKEQADSYDLTTLALVGHHQKENAALALMVLKLLQELGWHLQKGFIQDALKLATLPGRLEKIHEHPTIILDSAHNVAGVKALANSLQTLTLPEEKSLLFAGFADKQLTDMMEVLRPLFANIYVTTFQHERAATKEELDKQVSNETFVEQWEQKVEEMLEGPANQAYVISGSLHFITIVRDYIISRNNKDYC